MVLPQRMYFTPDVPDPSCPFSPFAPCGPCAPVLPTAPWSPLGPGGPGNGLLIPGFPASPVKNESMLSTQQRYWVFHCQKT